VLNVARVITAVVQGPGVLAVSVNRAVRRGMALSRVFVIANSLFLKSWNLRSGK